MKGLFIVMATPKIDKTIDDKGWGCSHTSFIPLDEVPTIRACIVTIEDLKFIAEQIASLVLNTSWILELDAGTQKSYAYTAQDTADALVKICKEIDNNVSSEFGEIMVSIGSSRALATVFNHISLPIAELWKPQVTGNEGFDFHTTCPNNLLNFGEAKFLSEGSPHGIAINQAHGFINKGKHFRDRVHLVNLASIESVANLDKDQFGVIVAFSINAQNPETVMQNAINSVSKSGLLGKAKAVYVVGVICK